MALLILTSCKSISAQGTSVIKDEKDKPAVETMSSTQQTDNEQVMQIFRVLDNHEAPMAEKMALWSDELVYLAPGKEAFTRQEELQAYFEEQNAHGHSETTHKIVALHSFEEIVVVQAQVDGTYYPKGAGRPAQFRTKNLLVLKRQPDQSLKIWQAISNHAPFIGKGDK
jgi:ketosteroid isomerase-like protein